MSLARNPTGYGTIFSGVYALASVMFARSFVTQISWRGAVYGLAAQTDIRTAKQ